MNRSTSREATAEELNQYGAYDAGLSREQILGVCTYTEDTEIGKNTYKSFVSEALPQMLYRCAEVQRIAVDEQENLYVQYTDPDNRNVTLVLDGAGTKELAVYDPAGDLLFHRTGDTTVVWERFATGIQWGK